MARRAALVLLLLGLARAASAARLADFVNVAYGEHAHGEGASSLSENTEGKASTPGHPCNGLSSHRLQQELRGIFSHIATTAEALLPASLPRLLPGDVLGRDSATAAAEEQFQELLEDALEQESATHKQHFAASHAAAAGGSVEAGSSWKHSDSHEIGHWPHNDVQELQDALNRDASHAALSQPDNYVVAVDPKPHSSGLTLPHVNELTVHSDDGHTTSYITTVTRGSSGDISVSSTSSSSYITNSEYEADEPTFEQYYDDDSNWEGDYYDDQGAYDDEQMHFEAPSASHVYFGQAARDDEAAAAADAAHLAVATVEGVARTVGAIMDAVHGGLLEAVVPEHVDGPGREHSGHGHQAGPWEMQKEPTLEQLKQGQQHWQQQHLQPSDQRVPWADALVDMNVDELPMVAGTTDDDAIEVAAVHQDGSMLVVVNGNTMLLDKQGALHELPMAFSDSLLEEGPVWLFRDGSGNPNWALLAMAVLSAASAATLVAFAYSWMALREAMEAEAAVGWGSGFRLSRGSSLDALEAPLLPPVEEAAKHGSDGSMHHNVLFQSVAGARQL